MVFSSLVFIFVFLPINLLLYFSAKKEGTRNWILIVFSLLFYAYGEPVWCILLIFSTTVDFRLGQLIEKYRGNWQSKFYLCMSVTVNLSLLGFFKYWNFLVDNMDLLAATNLPYHGFLLPIGISFYTFQTLSYSIDVYRGEVKAQKQYSKFLLFVSLFHQLVAGPIVRYKDICEEIENRVISKDKFSYGVKRFIQGLAKKVILANFAGNTVKLMFGNSIDQITVVGAWFATAMFAFQIYFDFSGYSDMAIGLGRMFGFTYKENFNYPYVAVSVTDFWRRWHISLGSFFRDYVYIPLGGNKKNLYRNLIVVWFLTGLWHGASWNFVLWGIFFAGWLIIEKLFLLKVLQQMPRIISHIYLIVVVLIGWVLFYFVDVNQAIQVLRVMFLFEHTALVDMKTIIYMRNNSMLFIIASICSTPLLKNLYQGTIRRRISEIGYEYGHLLDALIVGIVLVVTTALLIGETYNPFLYFRF